jgi:galactokinase/mevalonate kinase-like predicted kinase
LRAAYDEQVAVFPQVSNPAIRKLIRVLAKTALGWKLSDAGGGGYSVLVSQEPVPGAIQLRIRRSGE